MKQKGFAPVLILVGILILIAVAGGAFYLGKNIQKPYQPQNPVITSGTPSPSPVVISQTPQPTPSLAPVDETANWKTYTDTKYGLSFKYPASWFFKDATGIAPGSNLVVIAFFKNGTIPHITVGEGDPSGNEVLYLYIFNPTNNGPTTETKDQFIQGLPIYHQKSISIDGHPAGYDPGRSFSIWFNDKIQISVIPFNDGIEAGKYIDQILSTFKFTQ